MAGDMSLRSSHGRPSMPRSRSHTLPSSTLIEADATTPSQSQAAVSRPSYGRSITSTVPAQLKSREAPAPPHEKTSRLHIPGTSRGSADHRLHRHRYTQSHTEAHHRTKPSEDENLRHLLAGLSAEREKRHQLERLGTNTSDLRHGLANDPKRTGVQKQGQINPRDDLRRRATSDPRTPLSSAPVRKTSTEILLDRAEARKVANRAALTERDIEEVRAAQDAAEQELRDRLADLDNTSNDVSRRLDYTYYGLLEKLNNLKGTIDSFQNLTLQSQHLITNFEHETEKLDDDISRRVKRFREGFDDRQSRVIEMEGRGNLASQKAKELGTRLESAQVVVENWAKREAAAKQKWFRFWGMCWWSIGTMTICILVVIVAKEWWFHGDPVAAGLSMAPEGSRNSSWALNQQSLREVEVPLEVREVLAAIEEKRRTKKIWQPLPEVDQDQCLQDRKQDEKKLRLLDEL